MARRTILLFIALDLAFKLMLVFPTSVALGALDLRIVALLSAGPMILWLATVALVLEPIERWLRAEREGAAPPQLLERAGRALFRFPTVASAGWGINWVVYVSAQLALSSSVPSWTAAFFFLGAVLLGPIVLIHPLSLWLVAPLIRKLSATAHARGVALNQPEQSLRNRILVYAFCLAVAPTLFTASSGFAALSERQPFAAFLAVMLFSLIPVTAYAVLGAILISVTITRPLQQMTQTIRAIAEQGDVKKIERIPLEQRDEIGVLAGGMNEMVAQLERTSNERTTMRTSLEALNVTLEERVVERTQSLTKANESLAQQMRERASIEIELRQAQKLEAVGRLAAGVAHEINTPLQFVSDNTHFVKSAFDDLVVLIDRYRAIQGSILQGTPVAVALELARKAEEEADLQYVLENAPGALDQTLEGLERVTVIVRSMKQFAHPDQKEMMSVDLNSALESTLSISKHEYRFVADVETHLGVIPQIRCYAGELNQVFLNLIVNAAHAIADVADAKRERGRITVSTRQDGDAVLISIADTGGGIPEAIQHRIYDPFFTTKEVGRGTGQGLAIARSVVTEKHGGTLWFESVLGQGTTFLIRLPIDPPRAGASAPPVPGSSSYPPFAAARIELSDGKGKASAAERSALL